MALITDLKAYWKLDGDSNDSVDSNNGTDTSVSYVTGKIEKAGKYVNSSSYTDFGTLSSLWNGSNDKATFSFWFKADDISAGNHFVLAKHSNYSEERFIGLYISVLSTGVIRVFVGGTDNNNNYKYWITQSGYITSDNTWYHIIVKLDLSTGTCNILVNNDSKALTATIGGTPPSKFLSNSITFKIGRIRNLDGSYGGMINGYVDEIGVWNKILTSTETAQLYNNGDGLRPSFSSFIPQMILT